MQNILIRRNVIQLQCLKIMAYANYVAWPMMKPFHPKYTGILRNGGLIALNVLTPQNNIAHLSFSLLEGLGLINIGFYSENTVEKSISIFRKSCESWGQIRNFF